MTIKNTLMTVFATALLSSIAVPALAQDEQDQGLEWTWTGVLEQNGTQKPLAMRFSDDAGLWSGSLDVDGASSPMEKLRVDGNHVTFALAGGGRFDGVLLNHALVGSVSGRGSSGTFTVKTEEPAPYVAAPVESPQ